MTATTTRPASQATVAGPTAALSPAQAQLHGQVQALARRLRLPYLRAQLPDTLAAARSQRWDPGEVVRVLLDAEAAGRDAATIASRRRAAGFAQGKTFAAWNAAASSIPAAAQQALRTLEWVARHENLCIAGPSGTGKSHFLEALGHHGIDKAARSPGARWKPSAVSCAATASTTRSPKPSPGCCASTWSSSMTSACSPSAGTPPRRSTG